MIQLVLAQAILAELVTKDEADAIAKRLQWQPLPDTPSDVYDALMWEIAQERSKRPEAG
jgi:hypothetical protein